MHHDQFVRLVDRALQAGASRKSPIRVEWDVAGNCQAPVMRELHVRPEAGDSQAESFIKAVQAAFPGAKPVGAHGPDRRRTRSKHVTVKRGSKLPLTLLMSLRCRKCDPCRMRRQRMWSSRAKAETQASVRTWFGTLTLNPAAHMTMLSRARVRLAQQGVDLDAEPYGEQFLQRHFECSIEITKYLKRIRKESGAKFRYLLVAEHHKSGLPHYHVLLHERDGIGVKHRTLATQWQIGFEKWRIVSDIREAAYLCKYLSKATVARVRASGAYGQAEPLTNLIHSPKGRELRLPNNNLVDLGNPEERSQCLGLQRIGEAHPCEHPKEALNPEGPHGAP